MKYTIETTDNGCIETLEFLNEKYTKRSERTEYGCRCLDKNLSDKLEESGFCEEIVEKIFDMFDVFANLNFLEVSELEQLLKFRP